MATWMMLLMAMLAVLVWLLAPTAAEVDRAINEVNKEARPRARGFVARLPPEARQPYLRALAEGTSSGARGVYLVRRPEGLRAHGLTVQELGRGFCFVEFPTPGLMIGEGPWRRELLEAGDGTVFLAVPTRHDGILRIGPDSAWGRVRESLASLFPARPPEPIPAPAPEAQDDDDPEPVSVDRQVEPASGYRRRGGATSATRARRAG